jgi:hypothetical protein
MALYIDRSREAVVNSYLPSVNTIQTPEINPFSGGRMSTAAVEEPRQVARKFLARPQHEGVGAVVRRSIGR